MSLINSCMVDGTDIELDVEQLNRIKENDSQDSRLGKLRCVRCGCKLEFHKRTEKRKPFLSTWPGNKHDEGCSFYFEYKKRMAIINSKSVKSYLTSRELKEKARYMTKKMHGEFENLILKSAGRKVERKSGRVDGNTKRKSGEIRQGSVRKEDANNTGEKRRSSKMTYKVPGELSVRDIGKTIVLGGILEKVDILNSGNQKAVVFTLASKAGVKERIYTAPEYFAQTISGLEERIESLKNILTKEKPEFVCFVYVIMGKNGEVEGDLYEEGHIYFPDITLAEYIGRHNRLTA